MAKIDDCPDAVLIDSFVHEIKTPMTTIKLYSELISDSQDLDKISKNAKKIDAKVDDITQIVNYFRDISKITSGNIQLDNQNVDYDQIISITINRLALLFPQVKINQDGHTFAHITIDRSRLEQLFDIVFDRIFYYRPDTNSIFIHIWSTKNQIITYISTSPYPDYKVPDELHESSRSLPNPNTALYYFETLISYYHGYSQLSKDADKNPVFVFSLPIGQ